HTRLVSDWSSDVCSSDLCAITSSAATSFTLSLPSSVNCSPLKPPHCIRISCTCGKGPSMCNLLSAKVKLCRNKSRNAMQRPSASALLQATVSRSAILCFSAFEHDAQLVKTDFSNGQ